MSLLIISFVKRVISSKIKWIIQAGWESLRVLVVPGYAGRQSGRHAGGARRHLRGRSLQRATPKCISADCRRAGPGWNRRSSERRGGVKRRRGRRAGGGASHCRGTARGRSRAWGWFTLRRRTDRERHDLNILNKGKMYFCYYGFIKIKRSCV